MRRISLIMISVVLLFGLVGASLFYAHRGEQRAERAAAAAQHLQQLADDRAVADKAAKDKAAQVAHDKKLVDDAVKKALAEKPPAKTARRTSAGITLASLGSKPCAALAARGVTYERAQGYYYSFGFPAAMDIDHDGHPCETVYGDVN
jgi:hypothetical protein